MPQQADRRRASLELETLEGRWQPASLAGFREALANFASAHCASSSGEGEHERFSGYGAFVRGAFGFGFGDRFEHDHGHHSSFWELLRHWRDFDCDKPDPDPEPEPELGSLSGFVFLDDNVNGVLDEGEQPLPNTAIVLSWTDANDVPHELNTTTDANGLYLFDNLEGGIEYTITETQPQPNADGADYVGSLGNLDEVQVNDQFRVLLLTGAHGENYNFTEVFGGE